MNKSLFKDFNSVSSKEWKQKIQVDLKGADYNDTLIWKTAEGIDVKPFYHADEFEELPNNSNTKAKDWKISQSIDVSTAVEANTEAKDALSRGADHIIFNLKSDDIAVEELVTDIDTEVYINPKKLSSTLIKQFAKYKNVSINNDIIGHLGKTGNWFQNLKEDHIALEESVKSTNKVFINLSHYQNAGCTNVQELSYALAHVNEYLNHFDSKNFSLNKVEVIFIVAIGSNYFFEISKLRALRRLWHMLSKTYNANPDCKIIATPSKRNKTIYDYNVNLLRTTTESMSAILGGANIICNQSYNHLFQNPTEFGERISRNQLLILRSESYFDAVNNPSDGSYYIESLTEQLAQKSLDLFKDIEKNGGFLNQLKTGTIQRKIKEGAAKEQQDFDEGKITLLGTNKHPNSADKMKASLEKEAFLNVKNRKTLIEPIIQKRLSELLEIKRLKEE